MRVAVVTGVAFAVAASAVLAAPSAEQIDQAALSTLAASYGLRSKVVAHVDLTAPFHTARPWTLVVAKQPDEDGTDARGAGNVEGAVSVCFVKEAEPDCTEAPFLAFYAQLQRPLAPGERPFYELREVRVVHAAGGMPLLILQACSAHGGNGSCGISTFLFAYDAARDGWRAVFSSLTGSNNNQATRFIERGPLQGAVAVATPTTDAPFGYWMELWRPAVDGSYGRVLRYRSRTRYGDGNPLPVVDSEMPELLRRLGAWKAGDALPVPPVMPQGCTRLYVRGGAEWCGPARP